MTKLYRINEGVYEHYVEFLPSIDDCVSMQFKTKWHGADNPDELHNKFQIIMSKKQMLEFGKQLIEQASK